MTVTRQLSPCASRNPRPVKACRKALTANAGGSLRPKRRPPRLVPRTGSATTRVKARLARGESLSSICRALCLTARPYDGSPHAHNVEQLLGKARSRGSLLDAFKPCLHQRFNAGCTEAAA